MSYEKVWALREDDIETSYLLCDSLKELLEDNPTLVPGDPVLCGDKVFYENPTGSQLAEAIVEHMLGKMDYPDGYSIPIKRIGKLVALLDGWVSELPNPSIFLVENIEEHIITEAEYYALRSRG